MKYFKHESALVETDSIGQGTRIGAFAHVLAGAVIGQDCQLSDHVFIGANVEIGNNSTISNGVQLWAGTVIEENVFVGPNATLADGGLPRGVSAPGRPSHITIRRGAAIGANATLFPGVTIGANARVGAGAVVTLDVPPHAVVEGNPARIVGYEDMPALTVTAARTPLPVPEIRKTSVDGVTLHRMPYVEDLRGYLSFGEISQHLPFIVKRYFVVFDVANKEIRGEHAHRELEQFLVCVHGSCHIIADDGVHREEFVLDRPNIGIYIPPMVWSVQYKYSTDGVLMALASDVYKAEDYIREYSEFKALTSAK
jgi:acetyltransferase-like isoleucine patch superfamily enzyme/dTDP-4-dehydrorhamnose 3,5-epimerase-like enzyme